MAKKKTTRGRKGKKLWTQNAAGDRITVVYDGAAYEYTAAEAGPTTAFTSEAGIADYWFKYVGLNGAIVGMTTFGESAPAELLFEEFGFTVDNVVAKAKELL